LEGSQDEYEGNKDAARALMRVKQKLDGYEEGEMRSVHGQVIFQCHCYMHVTISKSACESRFLAGWFI
jgi:hypothetical protein